MKSFNYETSLTFNFLSFETENKIIEKTTIILLAEYLEIMEKNSSYCFSNKIIDKFLLLKPKELKKELKNLFDKRNKKRNI